MIMKAIRFREPKREVRFVASNVTLGYPKIAGISTIYPIEYKIVYPWEKEYKDILNEK
jgi:hypothetical protein